MFTKVVCIIFFILLMFDAPFSAAEGNNMLLDTNNASLPKGKAAIHPVVRILLDHYFDNTEIEESVTDTRNEVIRQESPGLSEVPFIPLNTVQYQSSDYFPLYYGTLWEYIVNGYLKDTTKVLPKLLKVNGVMTSVARDKDGSREYYTSDSNGILLHRLSDNVSHPRVGTVNLSLTFIPPLQMAAGMINIGQTFESSGIIRTNNLPIVGTLRFPYSASFSFAAIENITVPAGNFDVLKISGDITLQNETLSGTFYLAEDIGIVKETNGDTGELESVYYIDLLSPSEEEIIPSGETYTINWKTTPYTAFFKLLYSKDNGTTWNSITPDLITGTSFDWYVPSSKNNKTACLIKIIGYDSDGVEKTSVISKPFTIEVVKLTSPDGGETLTSNSSWPITWNTNVTNTPVAKVILKYTTNSGTTWKTVTKITGSNPGTYDWNIPVFSREKTKCKVKIILQDANGKVVGTDMSDDYFTISP